MSVAGESIFEKYDRAKELKEFDESKAGVKGLVDSGVLRVPRIFIHPKFNLLNNSFTKRNNFQVPVIDFGGLEESGTRREIVEQIREASKAWGFFQMVNHRVPHNVMKKLLEASRRFHEQPNEDKVELYSRDARKKVRFISNGNLYGSLAASWRDTLACQFFDDTMDPESLPLVCRKEIQEYMRYILKLRTLLSELLSEALGLSKNYLSYMECMQNETLACQFYPACPEPELTMGAPVHSDPSLLTILLQDNIGGLQVKHQDCWVDVPPVPGVLVANLGDLMQIITNDNFKSVEHRVLSGSKSRSSVACLFSPSTRSLEKAYGPIKELISIKRPPIYRDIMVSEYFAYYRTKGQDGNSALPHFKV